MIYHDEEGAGKRETSAATEVSTQFKQWLKDQFPGGHDDLTTEPKTKDQALAKVRQLWIKLDRMGSAQLTSPAYQEIRSEIRDLCEKWRITTEESVAD